MSIDTKTFEDKVALVTGAGRGIGRAISLGLAAKGARVILLARSREELDSVKKAVEDIGGNALVMPADMGDPAAVDVAASRAIDAFGAVDILINNAGVVWPLGPFVAISATQWAEAIGINLIGPMQLTLSLLPGMLDGQWGRIVNVSSGIVARKEGMVGGNAYTTSKAALEAHTLNLAAELEGTGVTVNGYRPGRVDTAMQDWIRSQPADEIGAELHERFVQSYEKGELLTPDASSRVLLEHLSSDSTGEIWSVRGA